MDPLWYMHRAHELALLGLGNVSPNPMVGCVIIYDQRIIGEGYHRAIGGPHAEVHAVKAVRDIDLLSQSTVYVSLEPCSHHGRTPPCASLLITHGVKKVVVSNTDPNPLVAGKGIAMLREAGIEVQTGLMEQEGLEINKRFYTFHQKKRPHVILKWAQTSDGFIAREDHSSKWISGAWSRKLVHKWRSEEDAVLVGRRTAAVDDPFLTTRSWHGKNPLRLVLDPGLKLVPTLHLLDGTLPTVCYTALKDKKRENVELVQYDRDHPVRDILQDLYARNILSVIIEGGSATIQSFINAGQWDEARIFTAPKLFFKGVAAPHTGRATIKSIEDIDGDRLTILVNDR